MKKKLHVGLVNTTLLLSRVFLPWTCFFLVAVKSLAEFGMIHWSGFFWGMSHFSFQEKTSLSIRRRRHFLVFFQTQKVDFKRWISVNNQLASISIYSNWDKSGDFPTPSHTHQKKYQTRMNEKKWKTEWKKHLKFIFLHITTTLLIWQLDKKKLKKKVET